ncbi:hypothetical protein AA0121_g13511 [Alternaria tenuissima]|nr:hypothetical protein AA0121_g13511 [Alternaria tenuissima]
MRFNQDCIFTLVSAQTQAFVPAHTAWRGVGQPPPMYGAYGQPLLPASHGGPYGQLSRQPQYLPSPTAGPYPAHPVHGPTSAYPDNASRYALAGRKRRRPEPHTPTLPPSHPGSASQTSHRGTGEGYVYPEPPSLTPTASTANTPTPYFSAPSPAQPCYTAPPPRKASPQSAYPYEPSHTSPSPDFQVPTTLGAPPTFYYAVPPQPNGALQPPPVRSAGRTPPPPTSIPSPKPNMRINDPTRSSTDASMLNMLNQLPM